MFQSYTKLGYNQGTYRYSVEGDTVIGETCGLGEIVFEGQNPEDTKWMAEITTAVEAPDPERYEIPNPLDQGVVNDLYIAEVIGRAEKAEPINRNAFKTAKGRCHRQRPFA